TARSPTPGCRRADVPPAPGPGTPRCTSPPYLPHRFPVSGPRGPRGLLPRIAELLLEHAEVLEQLQGPAGRLLVQPLQREPDVHDGVLTHLQIGQVLQAHLLDHTAEVDGGHAGAVPLLHAQHAAGYRKTHPDLLTPRARDARARHRLAARARAATTSWPRASPPSF